jgi:hypothetical protein
VQRYRLCMHTPNPNPVVLATPSGHPFRASHVIAAHRGKSPDILRIVIDGGETLTDRWSSEDEAATFLSTVHLGMRGIEFPMGERDAAPVKLPRWATVENAEVVAREVEKAGGARPHIGEAYSRTLLGIGEPASVIDADNIESVFNSALPDGKVLVLAGMPDPTHASTDDPILERSPLVRLALAAIELLMTRGRSATEAVEAIEFDVGKANSGAVTCVISMGEDGLRDVLRTIALPRMSFYHCMLSNELFADWIGWFGNPGVRRNSQESPYNSRFDASRPEHRAIVERIVEYFVSLRGGYVHAADRMRAAMKS